MIYSSVTCADGEKYINLIQNYLSESAQADLMVVISKERELIPDCDTSSEHTTPIKIQDNSDTDKYIKYLEEQVNSLENEKEMYKRQISENDQFDKEELIKKYNSIENTFNEKCEEYEELMIKYKEIIQKYSDSEYIYILLLL